MAKKDYNGCTLETFAVQNDTGVFFTRLNPVISMDSVKIEYHKKNPCKLLEEFKVTIGVINTGRSDHPSVRCNIDYDEWVYLSTQVKRAAMINQFGKNNQFYSYKFHSMQVGPDGMANTFRLTIKYDPSIAQSDSKKRPYSIKISEGRAIPVPVGDKGLKKAKNEVIREEHFCYVTEQDMLGAVSQTDMAIQLYCTSKMDEFKEGVKLFTDMRLKGRSTDENVQSEDNLGEIPYEPEDSNAITADGGHETEPQVFTVEGILTGEFTDTDEGAMCNCYFRNGGSTWLIFNRVTDTLRQSRETGTPVTLDIIRQNDKYYAREHVA